jgi:TolA-binding protein
MLNALTVSRDAAATFTAVVFLAGCATEAGVVRPSRQADVPSVTRGDLDDLQRRLERVEVRQGEAQAELARIREQVEPLASALGTMTSRLEGIQADLRDRLARLEERPAGFRAEVTQSDRGASEAAHAAEVSALRLRLEMVASALAALTAQVDLLQAALRTGRVPPVGGAGALGARVPGPADLPADAGAGTERQPRDLYAAASTDFSRGNYALAIGGYREFLRQHPDDPAADNAQYWIGEAYLGLAQRYQNANEVERAKQAFQEAVQAFRRVGERYPTGDKVAGALYREALVLLELQEPAQALARLEYLLEHFPRAPEALAARERISQLRER